MRELFRTLPLMCAVLLVPILPFLFFGEWFDAWWDAFDHEHNQYSHAATSGLVIGLLATDILLPIPSSVVSTMAGWKFGWLGGTIVSWVGMSLGAAFGFALARRWGRPLALWFSKEEDLDRMQAISERYGPFVLALTRAVPVFAEAGVLILGIHRLPWRRFLPAVLLSNLGVSLAYAAFGNYAKQNQWLAFALGISVAIPILAAAAAQRLLPTTTNTTPPPPD
ncbi:MAG: VTT domain-containing protein [Planctomycetales bacterium]